MIKSGKQYYLYNACKLNMPKWLTLAPPPPPHHLYIWPSDTLRVWGAPVSQPFMSLTPSFTCNHKRPQLSCFFFFLSQVILINGWETKETLPAATNYPMLQLPFLIHKCVKCLRNEKWKKKYLLQQKLIHLLTEAVGAYQNFHLSRILRCNS